LSFHNQELQWFCQSLSKTQLADKIKKVSYYHKKDGSYLEDGYYMDLGNYALDFTVPHRFVKITPSGNVQLMESNMSSHREEKKIGKVKWDSGNQHWYIWVTYPNDAYSINI